MKYFLCFIIIFGLIFSNRSIVSLAQASFVQNTISYSDINQYIVLNCQTEECQSWFNEIWELDENQVEDNSEVEDDEINNSEPGEQAEVEEETQDEEEVNPEIIDNPDEVIDEVIYSPGQVLINEIMAIPAPNNPEWVEVYNASDSSINLSNWNLIEGAGKKTSLSGVINSGDYKVFDKSSLNNAGDIVILEDPAGQIIDQISYGNWDDGNIDDNAPVSNVGNSIILFEGDYKQTEVPTPNQQNIFQLIEEEIADNTEVDDSAEQVQDDNSDQDSSELENTEESEQVEEVQEIEEEEIIDQVEEEQFDFQFSNEIRINEILADPEGSDEAEWVELYNSSSTDLDLRGWVLDDAESGSQPYLIEASLVVKANDYLVIKKEVSKLSLNNTNESVRLFDPAGLMIDSIDYTKANSDISLAYFDDGWQETELLTPGFVNEKALLQVSSYSEAETGDYYQLVEALEAKTLPLKSKIKVQGQVISLPGTFSKNNFYVDGLQIYYSKADWPELELADYVEVMGTISESYGERRLLIKDKEDIKLIDKQEVLIPSEYSSDSLSFDLVGQLVQVTGQLVAKESSTLVLADDLGEMKVYLKQSTGLKASLFEVGANLSVTGVLGRYEDELRLYPRDENDIVNLTLANIAVVGEIVGGTQTLASGTEHSQMKKIILIVFSLLLVINLFFLGKYKTQLLQKFIKKVPWFKGRPALE